MNENYNIPERNQNNRDLDRILNESTNSIFEGTQSVTNSSSSASGNPTVDKAKSEINAQADSMLREIEERRKRREVRQRELEQQVHAEAEAKARREARLKAQEDFDSKLRDAYMRDGNSRPSSNSRPIPKVSSSDVKFSNVSHSTNDVLDRFSTTPSKNETSHQRHSIPQGQTVQGERPRQRRAISSGETQVMPKISESKIPTRKIASSSRLSQLGRSVKQDETKRTQPVSHMSTSERTGSQNTRLRNNTSKQIPAASRKSTAYSAQHRASGTVNKKTKEVDTMKEIREWIIAIAIAIVVSLLIRNFVFTLVKVQGESMQPTLQNEDRLYVNRFFYSPHKGDVVIFKPASDPDRPYIKRVIATEGDTVFIDFETGDVYVNDNIINEPYIKDKTTRSGEYINELITNGEYSKDNPIVVEKGKIFVMGDNRNNSKDSRMIGQIPKDELIGGAVFRFWPLNKFGSVSYKMSYLIEDENMNFKLSA